MNLMEHFIRSGVGFVIRVKEDWLWEVAQMPMTSWDKDFTLELRQTQTKQDKIDYKNRKAKYINGKSKFGKYKESQSWDFELPHNFTIRVVRFLKPDGGYETVATNLNRFEFNAKDLCELYHLRWNEETSFRELKYNLALVNVHSRKENLILQEIYARLTMYNFCQRIAHLVVVRPRKENAKYQYQINFTTAVHICFKFFRYRGKEPPPVTTKIRRHITPIRPDRSDERKITPKSVVRFLYRVA